MQSAGDCTKRWLMLAVCWALLVPSCGAILGGKRSRLVVYDGADSIKLVRSTGSGEAVVSGLEMATSFDFSLADKLLFYQDNDDNIRAVSIGGSTAAAAAATAEGDGGRLVVRAWPGESYQYSLAVDWVTRKLYWSRNPSSPQARIEVADFDGANWRVLVWRRLELIRALTVDPLHGYMFWLNSFDLSVERAWLDGSHRAVIVEARGRAEVVSLAVDRRHRHVYVAETHSRIDSKLQWAFVKRFHYEGTGERVVFETRIGMPVYHLTISGDLLYWTTHMTGIRLCPKNACDPDNSSVILPMSHVETFRVFEPSTQPPREAANPCATRNGDCSHLCLLIPTPPYRNCVCPTGYKMLDDGKTCDSGLSAILLVVTRTMLSYISLDAADFTPIEIRSQQNGHAVAVEFDVQTWSVYYTDEGRLSRILLNGTGAEDVVTAEFEQSDGLAIDWVARNVYWTDAGLDRVEVARLDELSVRRVLVSTGLHEPRAIAVDPRRAVLFWTDWHESAPRIERSDLGGGGRRVFVKFDQTHWPNGLALDADGSRLYWCNGNGRAGRIESVDARDASARRVIVSDQLPHPFGFTMLDGWIYWTDWQRRSIERVRTDKTGRELLEEMPDLMGLKAVSLRQMRNGSNPCADKNGGCSHLCLYRPPGRVCMCTVGYELAADNRTCEVPNGYLMFTQLDEADVMRISLSRLPAAADRLRLHNLSQPFALDYDYAKERVFWSTSASDQDHVAQDRGAIYSAFLNGSDMRVLLDHGLRTMEGLAVDWLAGNLYWSEWDYRRIEVARLDGRARRAVVWRDTRPRVIALHPAKGYLYWANWMEPSTLERAELDGRNRVTMLSEVGRIYAIALDAQSERLFYSEIDDNPGGHGIYSMHLSGSERRLILRGAENLYPFAMTYLDETIYWSDWHSLSIEQCDARNGSRRSTLHEHVPHLLNLVAVHPLKQRGWNKCVLNNGGCEYLCFGLPPHAAGQEGSGGAVQCGCPAHWQLRTDGVTCAEPQSFMLMLVDGRLIRWKVSEPDDKRPRLDAEAPVVLPLTVSGEAHSLQYDPLGRTIYWIDENEDDRRMRPSLWTAFANGTAASRLELRNCPPNDLALDVFGRQLFVSCGHQQTSDGSIDIYRILEGHLLSFLGSFLRASDKQQPLRARQLAVDPLASLLYYVDVNGGQSIRHCPMNDSRLCSSLVSDGLRTPTALHVRASTHALFWSDGTGVRRWSTLHLDNGRSLATIDARQVLLAALGDRLVVVARAVDRSLVFSVDALRGGARDEPLRGLFPLPLARVTALVVADARTAEQARQSPCVLSHGRCSHICLAFGGVGGVARCGCPTGRSLSVDGRSCFENVHCGAWQWACANGQECIHMARRCDGHSDCADRSDERKDFCGVGVRSDAGWTCDSGKRRIELHEFCDGTDDCPDNSDELHCRCRKGYFDCDRTDSASPTELMRCIAADKVCDGHSDCAADGSADELPALCRSLATHPPPLDPAAADPARLPEGVTKSLMVVVILVLVVVGICFVVLLLSIWRLRSSPPRTGSEASHQFTAEIVPFGSYNDVDPSTGTTSAGGTLPMSLRFEVVSQLTTDGPVRSRLTGKSSSTTLDSRRAVPRPPPPSEASVSFSAAPSVHVRPHKARKRRHRDVRRVPRRAKMSSSDSTAASEAAPLRGRERTPPPPYAAAASSSRAPPPPPPPPSSTLAEGDATHCFAGGTDAPPPSPCSTTRSGRKQRPRSSSACASAAPTSDYVTVYRNPPPSPVNGSSDS